MMGEGLLTEPDSLLRQNSGRRSVRRPSAIKVVNLAKVSRTLAIGAFSAERDYSGDEALAEPFG